MRQYLKVSNATDETADPLGYRQRNTFESLQEGSFVVVAAYEGQYCGPGEK
jgi:hypothetical protein